MSHRAVPCLLLCPVRVTPSQEGAQFDLRFPLLQWQQEQEQQEAMKTRTIRSFHRWPLQDLDPDRRMNFEAGGGGGVWLEEPPIRAKQFVGYRCCFVRELGDVDHAI